MVFAAHQIILVIKLRMRWVVHVAGMGEKGNIQILEGKMKERDHLEDLGTDRRIILQWILKKKNKNGKS